MAWNRSSAESSPVKKKGGGAPSSAKGILIGLAIAVPLVALCLWLFTGGDDAPRADVSSEGSKRIKDSKPAARMTVTKKGEAADTNRKTEVPAKSGKEVKYELQRPEVVKAEKPINMEKYSNRVFNTTADQLISWIAAIEPGDMPMPMPPLDQRDKENIASILISKNEIREGDSDYIKEVKASVDFAKKEMAKYIGDGGDPDDFLQYYQRELLQAYELRGDAFQEINKTMEEDPEVGKKMMEIVNEKFAAQGIKQFKMEEFE